MLRALGLLLLVAPLHSCCLENSCPHGGPSPCASTENTLAGPVRATPDGGAVSLTIHTSDKTGMSAHLRKLDAQGKVVWVTPLGSSFVSLAGEQRIAVLDSGASVVWAGGRLGGFDAAGQPLWSKDAPSGVELPLVFEPVATGIQVVVRSAWRAYLVRPDGTITGDRMLVVNDRGSTTIVDFRLTSDGGYLLLANASPELQKLDSTGSAQWSKSLGLPNALVAREVADGFVAVSQINGYSGLSVTKVSRDGGTVTTLFSDAQFSLSDKQHYEVSGDGLAASYLDQLFGYGFDGARRFTSQVGAVIGLEADGQGGFVVEGVGGQRCHELGLVQRLRGDGSRVWQASLEP